MARELPRFLPIQTRSGGGKTSNTIAHFALDFERKESVCVLTDIEPDRLARVPRQSRWRSNRDCVDLEATKEAGCLPLPAYPPRASNLTRCRRKVVAVTPLTAKGPA